MSKERDLLKRLINAVGNCEDTQAILGITEEAQCIFDAEANIKYYREELVVGKAAMLRAIVAIEYLLENFEQRFPEKD